MNKKPLLIILIVSVVVNLVAIFTFGFYWREQTTRRPGPPPGPPPPVADRKEQLARLQERFGLRASQLESLQVLDQVMRTTMRPVNDAVTAKQEELLALLKGRSVDRNRISQLSREVVALRADLETRSLGLLVRMRDVLTPEQRRELGELFVAFRAPGSQPEKKPGGPPRHGQPPDRMRPAAPRSEDRLPEGPQ